MFFHYDIECYPNFFSIVVICENTGTVWTYEISDWYHQGHEIMQLLSYISHSKGRMVGYNNQGYDWPVLDVLWRHQGHVSNQLLYAKSQEIISSDNPWENVIWQPDIDQVDLYKIHHFDNSAKRTSLKLLAFNMRKPYLEELPYDPNHPVTLEESRHLLSYNLKDVEDTRDFFHYSKSMIEFRDSLSLKYDEDMTNYNDGKIGEKFFIRELKKHGINANKYNQTHRRTILGSDIILPYISFRSPEFNRILDFFRSSEIDPSKLKGFFKGVTAVVDGFSFDFGAGGIHGSLKDTIVETTDTHVLVDSDVASYYTNLGISNNLYPEHLGHQFCPIYLSVYEMRKGYGKGTPENAMLKLALNVVYGKSNDIHSAFYDPQYTVSITINGQLLLCMLAEWLMSIPNFKLVQINTDGLTYLVPRGYEHVAEHYCNEWEKLTKLELEHAHYDRMCIRDVNSYLATVTGKDKVKRIGAYAYELPMDNPATRELAWHKDHSFVVVAKAAEAFLAYDIPVDKFIREHDDMMDFMGRTKVPKAGKLIGRSKTGDTVLQNITRYYVSNSGVSLIKILEPTPKQVLAWNTLSHWYHEDTGEHKVSAKPPSGKYRLGCKPSPIPPDRNIGIESGYLVTPCNNMTDHGIRDINYDYYISEAEKLCLGLRCRAYG